ncbi:hypothetical protein AAFC00_006740 [Neodothiora populina]|uniref:Mediator of RNA polymerase II transcription subunit 14 n=1 Tax=Neodothiora populina TaxID=2781224 RepID=A0ABR3PB08_9PEZI
MPGRLVMDQHAVQGPVGLKKDQTHAANQTNGSYESPPQTNGIGHSDFAMSGAMVGNENGTKSAAFPMNASPQSGAGDGKDEHPVNPEDDQGPPGLEHWEHTFVPMGKLLERVAQQCFSDLTELVDGLSDMPVQPGPPAINGASNHASSSIAPDQSAASIEKKVRLMNFAQDQKDRFLKTLVLSNWARNMDAMNSLIELRMWLQQQDGSSSDVADAIMRMKHNMIAAKMPNPNIQGALELLSTGKAPWMPDMGYIPPKPLNAKQLLKTLKDMNFALSVRLNLHEELPPRFRTYSIANGRATFVVADEFEVDLAVADEDPESPFYFIDLRLLFANSPSISDGAVRTSLEIKVNEVLETDGLTGCYRYLHDFVMTHRTNLLRWQALEMMRGKWNECIRVETIHRDFVVHYWTGQSGPKSWIQIGTKSNAAASEASASRKPHLGIRWIREGQDSPADDVDVTNTHQSMEQILEQIIARHIRWRLELVANRMHALSGNESALDVEMEYEPEDSHECSMEMRFKRLRTPLKLRMSPVTGNFVLSPASRITLDAENRINADRSMDAAQILSMLHCRLLQDQIRTQAHRLGWLPVTIGKQDDFTRLFGNDVMRWSIFSPRSWGDEYAIAMTCSLRGEKWWAIRLEQSDVSQSRTIKSAERLPVTNKTTPLHRGVLMEIESRSVAQISFSNITRQLRQRGVQYELQQARPTFASSSTQSSQNTTVLYLNFSDLMRPMSDSLAKTWKAWCHEVMILTHHGMRETSTEGESKVTHVLKASVKPQSASCLSKIINVNGAAEDLGMTFLESGSCALKLNTKFGEGLVALIEARLKRIERTKNYIYVAQQAKLQLTHTSVSRLELQYSSEPALSAELLFPEEADSEKRSIRLRLKTVGNDTPFSADANPHRQIQPLLQKLLEPADGTSLGTGDTHEYARFRLFLQVLQFTLPASLSLTALEKADASTTGIRYSAYSFKHHRLHYSAPKYSDASFDIKMHPKDGRYVWLVTLSSSAEKQQDLQGSSDHNDTGSNGTSGSDAQQASELSKALQSVWTSSGEGWAGLMKGAFAEKDGIEHLLTRLHSAVTGVSPPSAPAATEDASASSAALQQSAVKQTQKTKSGGDGAGNNANAEIVVLD